MSFSFKYSTNGNIQDEKDFLSCNNTRKNSFDNMNLPEILNPIEVKTHSPTTTSNKPRKLQKLVHESRKNSSNSYRKRTNTVMCDRGLQDDDLNSISEQYSHNFRHLKTVGEDEIESRISAEINKEFDQQVYMNTIKLNVSKNQQISENQLKNIQLFVHQQDNINNHFNRFFKKKIHIASTTPGKQNGPSSKSTRQSSLQSSPISLQQKELGSYNNFMLQSRRSTTRNGMSPDNEQKLQIQEFYPTNKLSEISKYETSISNKNSSKLDDEATLTPIMANGRNKQFEIIPVFEQTAPATINYDRFSSAKIKRKFKGANGLTPSILELWINDTLIEAQSDKSNSNQPNKQKIKPNVSLSGYNLDRKYLLSKGVKSEGIDRIYRSLFVYSFGFYEMLYEILEHLKDKDNIISQIWRVYGILLEYCAQADFTTTVNIIEKNKEEIVESLNKVIAEKSSQIKEIEVQEQSKQDKFQSELRNLTLENSEKQRLEEDNKLMDNQFNLEAKMRLQFEHKINELYSIHRELKAKHQRLITEKDCMDDDFKNLKKDYDQKIQEKQSYLAKYTQAAKELEELKVTHARLNEKYKNLEQQIVENSIKNEKVTQQNKEMNDEVTKKQLRVNELEYMIDNLKYNNKRVEEKKQDMLTEKEYYEQRIKAQQKLINEVQVKLNQKENQYAEITYKLEYDSSKIKDLNSELKDKSNQIYNFQKQVKGLQIDLEVAQNNLKSQEADLANLEKCIREYKLTQADTEGQYNKSLKQISQLSIQLDSQTLEIRKWMDKYETIDLKYQQLQNELRISQENSYNQMVTLKSRIIKLEQEGKKDVNDLSNLNGQLNQLSREKDDLQNELFDAQKRLVSLKDVNQEQNFMNVNFENSLMDKEKILEELKKQNIQILTNFTEYKIKLEQTQRELLSVTRQYDEYKKQTDYNIELIHTKYLKELSQYKSVEPRIHVMEHEDAISQIVRLKEKVFKLEEKVKEKDSSILFVKQQREATEENRRAVEKSKSDLVSRLSKVQALYDQAQVDMQLLKNQIDSHKSSAISQHEQLGRHFSKELQESKDGYEEQIRQINETLMKQIKELEGQFKYTMQKNLALKEENEKLSDKNVQLEDEIKELSKNGQPYSPQRTQTFISSRPNSKMSKTRESEPNSPLRSPTSQLRSPTLKAQSSLESGGKIDLSTRLQAIQLEQTKQQTIDQEVQTSFRELPGVQNREVKLSVLQNISNMKSQDDTGQGVDLYNKMKQLHQDSLCTNNQASIIDKNPFDDKNIIKAKKQTSFQDQLQGYDAESNVNNNNGNNNRPKTVEHKGKYVVIKEKNVTTAYESLKSTDRYPTDKYSKKPKLTNQDLAKILNISLPEQQIKK